MRIGSESGRPARRPQRNRNGGEVSPFSSQVPLLNRWAACQSSLKAVNWWPLTQARTLARRRERQNRRCNAEHFHTLVPAGAAATAATFFGDTAAKAAQHWQLLQIAPTQAPGLFKVGCWQQCPPGICSIRKPLSPQLRQTVCLPGRCCCLILIVGDCACVFELPNIHRSAGICTPVRPGACGAHSMPGKASFVCPDSKRTFQASGCWSPHA